MIKEFTWTNIENVLRLSVPHIILAFFFMLNVVAWPFVDASMIKPYMVLIIVYYWSIFRPTLMPIPVCFLIGILLDLIGGTPVGLHAFLLVTTHWIVRDQRRFLMGQPYITNWAVFAGVSIAYAISEWALMGLVNGIWDIPKSALIRAVLTIALFPFATILLINVHKILPVAYRASA